MDGQQPDAPPQHGPVCHVHAGQPLVLRERGAILRAFVASPPDQILLVHRDCSEYGPRFFGYDFAQGLATWIGRQYTPIRQLGAWPGQSQNGGMALLSRRW